MIHSFVHFGVYLPSSISLTVCIFVEMCEDIVGVFLVKNLYKKNVINVISVISQRGQTHFLTVLVSLDSIVAHFITDTHMITS